MKQRKQAGAQQCQAEEQKKHNSKDPVKREEGLHERLRPTDPDKAGTESKIAMPVNYCCFCHQPIFLYSYQSVFDYFNHLQAILCSTLACLLRF